MNKGMLSFMCTYFMPDIVLMGDLLRAHGVYSDSHKHLPTAFKALQGLEDPSLP